MIYYRIGIVIVHGVDVIAIKNMNQNVCKILHDFLVDKK